MRSGVECTASARSKSNIRKVDVRRHEVVAPNESAGITGFASRITPTGQADFSASQDSIWPIHDGAPGIAAAWAALSSRALSCAQQSGR